MFLKPWFLKPAPWCSLSVRVGLGFPFRVGPCRTMSLSNVSRVGSRRPEIVDFGSLGGPGRPGNLPKSWGSSPSTYLEGFPAARSRLDPQHRRFPVGQQIIHQKPWCSLSVHVGPDFPFSCRTVTNRVAVKCFSCRFASVRILFVRRLPEGGYAEGSLGFG